MFYQCVLPTFTSTNEFLQRGEPLIHLVHDKLEDFLKKFISKFIVIDAMQGDLCKVDFDNPEIQKGRYQLFVGLMTR